MILKQNVFQWLSAMKPKIVYVANGLDALRQVNLDARVVDKDAGIDEIRLALNLLLRKLGKMLFGCTKPTPVCVNLIPFRFQNENCPPTKFGSSKIASKPVALPSVGFESP